MVLLSAFQRVVIPTTTPIVLTFVKVLGKFDPIPIHLHNLLFPFRLGGGVFSLPSNLEISIQQLVHAVECVCTDGSTSCGGGAGGWSSTLVRQDLLLDCIMAFITK